MGNKYGGFHENPGGKPQSNEWYTPPKLFTSLNTTFDLDVAAPKGGVPWVPAKNHFYKEIDGLKQDWYGFVWCNPPYGKHTSVWLEKFINHGNGIALVNSRTDTRWFHNFVTKADILCFIKGRLAFYKGNVQAKYSSTGSLLVGCGEKAVNVIIEAKLGLNVEL
tara:strand:- start:657 stop:1148 length:492 start_codon:yes stop_codon:yes gene_type:complete